MFYKEHSFEFELFMKEKIRKCLGVLPVIVLGQKKKKKLELAKKIGASLVRDKSCIYCYSIIIYTIFD